MCCFQRSDVIVGSTNFEIFLEVIDFVVSYNEMVGEVITKALKNSSYISPRIQEI
jgi:hypothetical protein